MTNYEKLVEALRKVADYINCYDCDMWGLGECDTERKSCVLHNAADAIEALQAQMPKRGEWVYNDGDYIPYCSICGMPQDTETPYCHFCGAKMMEVQND